MVVEVEAEVVGPGFHLADPHHGQVVTALPAHIPAVHQVRILLVDHQVEDHRVQVYQVVDHQVHLNQHIIHLQELGMLQRLVNIKYTDQ